MPVVHAGEGYQYLGSPKHVAWKGPVLEGLGAWGLEDWSTYGRGFSFEQCPRDHGTSCFWWTWQEVLADCSRKYLLSGAVQPSVLTDCWYWLKGSLFVMAGDAFILFL